MQENLKIINMPIDDLKFAEYNPRKADEKQFNDLKKSLEEFGFVDPIVVNSAKERLNTIIGGHFRVRVAKEMGIKEVPCVFVNIPDVAKEQELNLRLNKNLGEWDWDALANIDIELLEEVGFIKEELDKFLKVDENEFDVNEEIKKIDKPKTKIGDLYQLGNQRLFCGDSTKEGDIEKLMNGTKADIILTDPPYNLNVEGVENDNLEDNEFIQFNTGWLSLLPYKDTSLFCCFHSTRTFPIILDLARQLGWIFERYLTLYKSNDRSFPWKGWLLKSEAILLFSQRNGEWPKPKYGILPAQHDTYNFIREERERVHAPQDIKYDNFPIKPLVVVADIIKRMTKKDAIIYDCFLGSGTTLIASEQLKRKCYGLEINPAFCDVLISRWCKITNNTKIIRNGESMEWRIK